MPVSRQTGDGWACLHRRRPPGEMFSSCVSQVADLGAMASALSWQEAGKSPLHHRPAVSRSTPPISSAGTVLWRLWRPGQPARRCRLATEGSLAIAGRRRELGPQCRRQQAACGFVRSVFFYHSRTVPIQTTDSYSSASSSLASMLGITVPGSLPGLTYLVGTPALGTSHP